MSRTLRSRLSPCVALVLSTQLVVAGGPALAQPRTTKPAGAAQAQDLVAKGRQLFEDQQYEESIQALSAALLRPNSTREQKVEIYRLLALNYITLGRTDEADSAVRGVLGVEPTYELPTSESPRFRDFFAQTRASWEAEGRPGIVAEAPKEVPVVLRHGSPSSAEKDKAIELHGKLEGAVERTGSVKIFYRTGSRGDFTEGDAAVVGDSVRARIPSSAVKPPVVDYYFEVRAADGSVIASRGDAQAPLRIAVPDGGSPGWVLPVAIGGGILGAAAIVGGLALAGVFSSSSPQPARSTVTINVGEAGLRW